MSALPAHRLPVSFFGVSRRQCLQRGVAVTTVLLSQHGLAGEGALVGVIPNAPAIVGTVLPARSVLDAKSYAVHLDASVRALVFTADKQASAWVNPVLADWGAAAMVQHRVIALADISAMPALITRMFALPKLRELPFSLGLVLEAAQTADLPRQPGQATLILLKALEVTDIRFLPDVAALQSALQALPLVDSP